MIEDRPSLNGSFFKDEHAFDSSFAGTHSSAFSDINGNEGGSSSNHEEEEGTRNQEAAEQAEEDKADS
jgi:hypothetical protein